MIMNDVATKMFLICTMSILIATILLRIISKWI